MVGDIITDEIIIKAQNGNVEAINLIIEEYKNLIFMNIQNYFLIGAEQEDLLQEGSIGLLKAIQNYKKGKASFKTFATICIRRQIISAVRTSMALKNNALNAASTTNEFENGEEVYPKNLVSLSKYNPEKIILSKEKIKDFEKYVNSNFSPFEREVFGYMIQGFSYKEIATKLDRTPKTIDNSFQRIKRKAENWLSSY